MEDKELERYLEERDIDYEEHHHQPVSTVEESKEVREELPDMLATKNLFLKEEGNDDFYLVSMYGLERLDMSSLAEKLGTGRLTFASPEELEEELNVEPGSVSLFNMIYTDDVALVLDKRVWEADRVGFHPNTNDCTLLLDHEALERFYESLDCEKSIVELE